MVRVLFYGVCVQSSMCIILVMSGTDRQLISMNTKEAGCGPMRSYILGYPMAKCV